MGCSIFSMLSLFVCDVCCERVHACMPHYVCIHVSLVLVECKAEFGDSDFQQSLKIFISRATDPVPNLESKPYIP